MTTGQKTTISLLVTVLLFGLFTFFAFSDLFRIIEVTFYSQRTTQELTSRLQKIQKSLDGYIKEKEKAFDLLLGDLSFSSVFLPTQSKEDIQARAAGVNLFFRGIRGPAALRILDQSLNKIHFSTVESDVLSKSDFSLVYKDYKALTGVPDLGPLIPVEKSVSSVNLVQGALILSIPMKDNVGKAAGFAFLNLSLEDFKLRLFENGDLNSVENFYLIDPKTFVFSLAGGLDSKILTRVKEIFSAEKVLKIETVAEISNQITLLMATAQQDGYKGGAIVTQDFLKLNWLLKVVILISGFSVIFLMVFFILNFRSDQTIVLRKKIKRFQIQVLQGYLSQKTEESSDEILGNLYRNGEKIKQEIRKGLGKIRKKDRAWAEELIDRSWDDILDLMGVRRLTGTPDPGGDQVLTVEKIEKIIKEALEKGRFSISVAGGAASIPQTIPSKAVGPRPMGQAAAAEVEELEELEEDSVVEELEELSDDSEKSETVEDLEELEEISDEDENLEVLEELPEEAEEVLEVLDSETEVQKAPDKDQEPVEELEFLEDLDDEMPPDALVGQGRLGLNLDSGKQLEEALDQERLALETYEQDLEAQGPLELLEPVEPDDLDAEELEPLDDGMDPVTFVPGTIHREAEGFIGTLQTSEDLGDAELLEPVEDLDSGMIPTYSPTPTRPDKHPEVRIFTLNEITEFYLAHPMETFKLEDQVLTLASNAGFSRPKDIDPEFASLVDSVLSESGALPSENPVAVLSPHFVGFDIPAQKKWGKPWRWAGEGYDLDNYLAGYQHREAGFFKGLIDLTVAFGAFAGALLVRSNEGFVSNNSVGFSDQGKENLKFQPGNELYDDFLAEEGLFLFDGEPGHNRHLYKNLHPKDLRYIRAVILAPVIYKHQPAYLLLAFKEYPNQPLELLKPRDL